MAIATVNPTTGEVEKTFEPHSPAQVEAILDAADKANALMRATTFAQRRVRQAVAACWTTSARSGDTAGSGHPAGPGVRPAPASTTMTSSACSRARAPSRCR